MSAAPPRNRLLDSLDQLASSRAHEARLVLESGPIYMVWTVRAQSAEVEHQSVASAALPAEYKLSSERGAIMRELGFGKRGGGRRNWRRSHGRDRGSLERSADEALDILARVYGVDAPVVLALSEDREPHPQNPDLLATMRVVAKGWNEEKRRAMYTAMLNATFLVPITPELEDDADAEGAEAFLDFETHASGRPTLGAFTDWASLRLWEPRGHEYWPIHGSELFEMAMERRPVTLRINPNGDIGGELYAHEVEMLVRAVKTFRRRQN